MPRTTAQVQFPGGLVIEAPRETPLEAYIRAAWAVQPTLFHFPVIAGIVNGRLRELTYPIVRDSEVSAVMLNHSDGARIFRRTLTLLLLAAAHAEFPGVRLNIGYAVPNGAFYCMTLGRPPFTADEVARLDARMRALRDEDLPIGKQVLPLDEAVALFTKRGDMDKVRLLENRTRKDLTLYTLAGYSDYYYGYMTPSTGYLDPFALIHRPGGFLLQYPPSETPTELAATLPAESKIGAVFEQAETWLERIGITDMGLLNRAVRDGGIQELVLVAEAQHEQQLGSMAGEIYRRHHESDLRLILLAGPSSSGKTTSAKRLALHLLARGLRPFTIELDNYFVDRELTPRDEEGNYDFEALEAINLPLFNEQLVRLIEGEEVQLPRFDFMSGKSEAGPMGRLTRNQILICEGIHGMNPRLVTHIAPEKCYRIYVSPLSQLNLDAHNRIPTTDVRLLRRICRDAVQRGYNAAATIDRWASVRRGEKRNIFPYQENADAIFNASLVYELAALRPIAEPMLLQVEHGTRTHIEANRLLSFLRWVRPLSPAQTALIPDTSLLREFIGGSILADYHPGALTVKDV
jgi:uridine kinase